MLPYGFLLEDNNSMNSVPVKLVLLPYGFLLEDNLIEFVNDSSLVLLPYGFLLEDNHTVHLECHWKEGDGYES